jgi:ribosome-associated protein
MPRRIQVGPGVVVPAGAVSVRAVRSSGPGGQNVNKVASKVELRVDLSRIEGLGAAARQRLAALAETRRDADGLLVVVSQRTRDQHRNLEDAREKVRRLVALALREPRVRRPTTPTAAAREARLRAKRHQGQRKGGRRAAAREDD